MSVSFTGYAAIGCRVDIDKLVRITKTRGCGHDIPLVVADNQRERLRFCPVCASPLWVEIRGYIIPWNEFSSSFDLPDGIKTLFSTDHGEVVFATAFTSSSSYDDKCEMIPLDLEVSWYKEKLKSVLDLYGIWDESQFGLWSIPYISY